MTRNYFKIAWRNLIRDRQFSLLNLLGLSSALACVLLIHLWINNEYQVDKFNKKDSQIYQVLKTAPNATGGIDTYESSQGMLAKSMADDLPEVELAVNVRPQDIGVLSVDNKQIKVKSQFVHRDFFKLFSYPILAGSQETFLANRSSVMISDQLALKLFNDITNVIGKTVLWDRDAFTGPYTIAGVFKSPPANASSQFDMVFTFDQYASKESEDLAFWGSNNVYTYLLLRKGTDIAEFNKKIRDFTKKKIKQLYPDDKGLLHWEGSIFVQKYSDKYLYNRYENGQIAGGRIEYIRLFSVIAIFIVVIACINFMNLSTAKATKRMKEVGVKKVVGASRRSLILQYMSESVFMSFLALFLAMVITGLLLPAFSAIIGRAISLQLNSNFILSAVGIAVVTGILSGSYPALYLSGFRPVLVLKGQLNTSAGESWIRKGLVVFQFSISVILIVSVLVVYKQMQLIRTKNLGYNKDNIISFPNDGYLKNNLAPFLAEIKKIPGVVNATSGNGNFFGQASHGGSGIDWEGKDPALGLEYYGNGVDYDFFETMNMQIVGGRPFSRNFPDSTSVIFNEAAIAAMGLKDPIGKTVSLWGRKKQIVGVVKDYHFQSMYKKIGPAFMTWSSNNDNTLVKVLAGTEQQTIASIKNLFSKYNKGLDFNYSFLDDEYDRLYASEQKITVLSKYFAAIAIIISCLGLFGLAAFTAQKRQKEIGIRKVTGATASHIAVMLSKDFFKLILVAMCIAFPFAWWLMNKWLGDFAYRIRIGADVFLAAGISVIFFTLLTIGYQAVKAAVANPIKSLRTE